MMETFGPPKLKDDLPRYPGTLQLLRVTGDTIPGPGITGSGVAGAGDTSPSVLYVASTQQLRTDTRAPRDREPCLVVDVNSIGLTEGYYLGRLAGSYNNLPVYEVAEQAATTDTPKFVRVTATDPTTVTLSGGRSINDGVINGTTTLTSATAIFTLADVGKSLVAQGSLPYGTTVASYVSSTQVTMSSSALNTASSVPVTIDGMLVYAAVISTWSDATGAWSDGDTVWFLAANGEAPSTTQRYLCKKVGVDGSAVEVWSVHIPTAGAEYLQPQLTDQSIPNSSLTKITVLTQLTFDNPGAYTIFTGTFNTADQGNLFLVTCNIAWDDNANGMRELFIFTQGGLNCVAADSRRAVDGDYTFQSVTAVLAFLYPPAVSIDFYVFQDSGGALDIKGSSGGTGARAGFIPSASIIKLG